MGYKLKIVREEKKMSQEELSRKSNVSRATISAIENSSGSYNVTMDTLRKLANALGTTCEAIFFDDCV